MPIFNYKLNKLTENIEKSREKLKEFLISQGIEVQESYTLRKLIRLIPTKIIRPGDLDNTLYGHSMVNLGDNLVLISGGAIDANTVSGENYALDIISNIKISKLSFDLPRQKHSAVMYYSTSILFSGGLNGGLTGDRLTINQVYNIETNTFTTKLTLPSSIERHTANYNTNIVYLLGGITGSGWGDISNLHLAFNVSTNTFANKLTIGNYAGQTTINNSGYYYFGGQINQYSQVTNSVKRYDRNTDTFTSKQNLNEARSTLTSAYLKDDKVLLSGGYKLNNVKSSKNEIYNVSTNTYTSKRDLNPPRCDHASLCLEDRVVLVGGKTTLISDEVKGIPINIMDFYNFETDEFYRGI